MHVEPAFPGELKFSSLGGACANCTATLSGGMSLRDYFAGQVLCGLVMEFGFAIDDESRARRAAEAYATADAMLVERSKRRG